VSWNPDPAAEQVTTYTLSVVPAAWTPLHRPRAHQNGLSGLMSSDCQIEEKPIARQVSGSHRSPILPSSSQDGAEDRALVMSSGSASDRYDRHVRHISGQGSQVGRVACQ
jgi:hypothetical protein